MAAEAYLRASGVAVQAVSIIVLALMVVINATNITCRAVLGVDLEWTQEVSVIAAMVIYFFSFALIAKTNSDIRVEFIVAMLPRSWQRWLGIVSRLAVLGFQAAVLWLAINTLGFVSMFSTPVLNISEAIFYIPVIAGAADIAITSLIHLVLQLRGEMPAPGGGLRY